MTVTVRDCGHSNERGERFVMLTAYDVPTASILDEAGIPDPAGRRLARPERPGLRDRPCR